MSTASRAASEGHGCAGCAGLEAGCQGCAGGAMSMSSTGSFGPVNVPQRDPLQVNNPWGTWNQNQANVPVHGQQQRTQAHAQAQLHAQMQAQMHAQMGRQCGVPSITAQQTLFPPSPSGNVSAVGNPVVNDPVSHARSLIQGMDVRQLQAVYQNVGTMLAFRGNFTPERLGEAQVDLTGQSFLTDDLQQRLPGVSYGRSENDVRDVFSRSEKWLGSPPVPDCGKWQTREDEVIGFASYITSLVSWCSLGSMQFGREVEQATRWPTPILWGSLSKDQQARAVRLCSILKGAFANHSQISLMINSFSEGLDIIPGTSVGDHFGNQTTYLGNGFEMIRQLTRELSMRSRAEAFALRSQLLNRTFQSSVKAETDGHLSDVIRQIDLACAKFMRLISTIPSTEDLTVLRIEESDMLQMLIRSIPSGAREYVLLHSSGSTYWSFRESARRYENQHRLFRDVPFRKPLPMFAVVDEEKPSAEDLPDEDDPLYALNPGGAREKCTTCGKRSHQTANCDTDMSKVKCYKCGNAGHISLNCKGPLKTNEKGPGKGLTPGKGAGNSKGTSVEKGFKGAKGLGKKGPGKSKGSSKGKKGKMFAVVYDEEGTWWYEDWSEEWPEYTGEEETPNETEESDNVLVLSALLPCQDSGAPCLDSAFEDDLQLGESVLQLDCDSELELGMVWDVELEYDMSWNTVGHHVNPDASSGADDENIEHGHGVRCLLDSLESYVHGMLDHEDPDVSLETDDENRVIHVSHGTLCDNSDSDVLAGAKDELIHVVFGPVGNGSGCDVSMYVAGPSDVYEVMSPIRNDYVFLFSEGSSADVAALLNSVGPLLGHDFWLLDSGASISVVARSMLTNFQHSEIKCDSSGSLQAANGSPVRLEGATKVLLQISVGTGKGVKPAVLPVEVMVGETTYPILSVCALTKQGWSLTFGETVSMTHRETGCQADVIMWHNTPWLKVVPYEGDSSGLLVNTEAIGNDDQFISALTPQQMIRHRLRGHKPYDPGCEVCVSCRGVKRHARQRMGKGLSTEVVADYGYLKSSDSDQHGWKFLMLKETFSSSFGAVLITGDRQRDQNQLEKWLNEFGLKGGTTSIRLITDSESAVSAFVTGAGDYQFSVQRAPLRPMKRMVQQKEPFET